MIAACDDGDRLDHCAHHRSRLDRLRPLQRRGRSRPELGSEIELAPNRKPYYDDEQLEGSRLELVQFIGVLLLAVIVIGLPLYWVFEPSRQAGATEGAEHRLEGWGQRPVRSRPPTAASTAPAATAA